VLLRAAVLSLEALTLGGIAFLLFAALPTGIAEGSLLRLRKIAGWAALALFVAETLSISVSAAILIGGSGFSLSDVASADFFLAGIAILIGAGGLFLLLRSSSRAALFIGIPFALLILFSSVSMSHAAARMDHRIQLLSFTALHHIGTAAWIGARHWKRLHATGIFYVWSVFVLTYLGNATKDPRAAISVFLLLAALAFRLARRRAPHAHAAAH